MNDRGRRGVPRQHPLLYLGHQKSFSISSIHHERRSRILVNIAKRGAVSCNAFDCLYGRAQKLEPGKKIKLDQQEDLDIKITGVTFDENLVDQGRTSVKVHLHDAESGDTASFVLANLLPGKVCQTYSVLATCSLTIIYADRVTAPGLDSEWR